MNEYKNNEFRISTKALEMIVLRGFSFVFAFFLAFASPLSFANLLLCFEDDGAVHVESLDTSDCANKESPARAFIKIATADCHSCTDVTVGSTGLIDKTYRSLPTVTNSFAGQTTIAFRFDLALSVLTTPLFVSSVKSTHNDLLHLGTVRILV